MSADFPLEGVAHRFIDAGGLRVHLAEAGPPDGPPVLLLHGWPQTWWMWRRVIEALRGEFRLLAPELRGFGATEAPGGGYDGETLARDQVALLDALGIERADVVGHDWGGWTAFLLGVLHPARVGRLLVCDAPHPWIPPNPRFLVEPGGAGTRSPSRSRGSARRSCNGPDSRGGCCAVATSARRSPNPTSTPTRTPFARPSGPARQARSTATTGARSPRARGVAGAPIGSRRRRCFCSASATSTSAPRSCPGSSARREQRLERVPDSGHFLVDEKPDLVVERALELFR